MRNKIVYASSINVDSFPKLSADSDININACGKTSKAAYHKSWLTFDMENIYQIDKVCLLNSATGFYYFFAIFFNYKIINKFIKLI